MQNIREHPDYLYRGYDGSNLPRQEVATVWWDVYPYPWAVSVDGKVVKTAIYGGEDICPLKETRYELLSRDGKMVSISRDGVVANMVGSSENMYFGGAEVLPGQHTMEVCVHAYKSASATITIDADLSGGHVYRFEYDSRSYAEGPADYAVSLIDEETGALVAGRPPEVLKWSLSDYEQALQRLKRDSATEKQTIELLSEPHDRLVDNTLVYLARRHGKVMIYDWPIYVRPSADSGYLFVYFDEFHNLQGHIFVDVPFRECYQSPFTVWDAVSWHSQYHACRFRLQQRAYEEFRALTGRSAEYTSPIHLCPLFDRNSPNNPGL